MVNELDGITTVVIRQNQPVCHTLCFHTADLLYNIMIYKGVKPHTQISTGISLNG